MTKGSMNTSEMEASTCLLAVADKSNMFMSGILVSALPYINE